ncbi:hypothetical protein MM236_11335 [Belliella sp. DSM 107340]|uniref:Lipoprotein n=1 Tax=Belliella calami TaxID=2923436 RepID=A0ABS9UQ95_9BACT|nr:hypothetical protein [Belliella calami]MCH7398589.1 hypothetical protein [Belliella calami]
MKINVLVLLGMVLLLTACTKPERNDFDFVKEQFDIPQSSEWILVVNPSACKGCLDILFKQLSDEKLENGSLVIISPSIKTYLNNPYLSQLKIPIFFDTGRFLIEKNHYDVNDELILLSSELTLKFKTDDWLSLKKKIKINRLSKSG